MPKLDDELRHSTAEDAAFYEHRLQVRAGLHGGRTSRPGCAWQQATGAEQRLPVQARAAGWIGGCSGLCLWRQRQPLPFQSVQCLVPWPRPRPTNLPTQEGSKAIFHLEAFLARFMSNYKQARAAVRLGGQRLAGRGRVSLCMAGAPATCGLLAGRQRSTARTWIRAQHALAGPPLPLLLHCSTSSTWGSDVGRRADGGMLGPHARTSRSRRQQQSDRQGHAPVGPACFTPGPQAWLPCCPSAYADALV